MKTEYLVTETVTYRVVAESREEARSMIFEAAAATKEPYIDTVTGLHVVEDIEATKRRASYQRKSSLFI